MKALSYITLFIISLIVYGCDTMVTNVTPPQVDPELVIYGFISPDEPDIVIEVRRSMPIWSGGQLGNDTIANATVLLTDGTNQVQLPHQGGGRYSIRTSEYPLLPGGTYYLNVSTQEGEQANGQTTIPVEQVPIDSVVISKQPGPFGFTLDLINVYWRHTLAEKRFFQLFASVKLSDDDSLFSGFGSFGIHNEVLNSDQAVNGRITNTFSTSIGGGGEADSISLNIYLAHTDEAYYRYHLLRLGYSPSNPFREPTIMFENMTGARGVFASYRFYRYEMKLVGE
ncbi:MAG: DUF4249 domain-containing protein [Bacteroidia bacterium]